MNNTQNDHENIKIKQCDSLIEKITEFSNILNSIESIRSLGNYAKN